MEETTSALPRSCKPVDVGPLQNPVHVGNGTQRKSEIRRSRHHGSYSGGCSWSKGVWPTCTISHLCVAEVFLLCFFFEISKLSFSVVHRRDIGYPVEQSRREKITGGLKAQLHAMVQHRRPPKRPLQTQTTWRRATPDQVASEEADRNSSREMQRERR